MKLIDLIGVSLKSLWRRKLRTFLTILGVVIGTSSIVVMISLGLAMNKTMMESLEGMGSLNIINIYDYSRWNGNNSNDDEDDKLNDKKLDEIKAMPGVEVVSPKLEINVKMGSGRYYSWATIYGIDFELLKKQGIELKWGRYPNEEDRYGLVFGSEMAYRFYNPNSGDDYFYWGGEDQGEPNIDIQNDPVKMSYDWSFGEKRVSGEKQPRPILVTVTGEIKDETGDYSYDVYTDLVTARKIYDEQQKYEESENSENNKKDKKEPLTYDQAQVYVTDIDDVLGIQEQIKEMGFEAYSMADMLSEVSEMSKGVQVVLGGIGAVSLFVAALGITNTMIMSIYERTKEIGVMKVIGASLPDIRKMFLFEAAMIGFIGGLLGLALSFGISTLINAVGIDMLGYGSETSTASYIPLWLYLSALVFSSLVGLISGYFPARRAMKLSVLSALRNE